MSIFLVRRLPGRRNVYDICMQNSMRGEIKLFFSKKKNRILILNSFLFSKKKKEGILSNSSENLAISEYLGDVLTVPTPLNTRK